MDVRLKRAKELAGYAVRLTKDEGLPTMVKRGAGFVRRRFFGKDADAPTPGENALLPAPYNSAGSDGGRTDAAIRPELPGKFVPADQAGSTAP